MNLKLSIQEDEDLRNFIKSSIKGQITSVVRAELRQLINNLFDTRTQKLAEAENMIRIEITKRISNSLDQGGWNNDFIKSTAREEIVKLVNKKLELNI